MLFLTSHIIKYSHLYIIFLGCEYQSIYNLILDHRGSKVVLVKRKDMNKLTHSYTAQYSMSLSGKLLPTVYVCLQESFLNRGLKNRWVSTRQNMIMFSLLHRSLVNLQQPFLNRCNVALRAEDRISSVYILVGGQTNPQLYDEVFQDE